MIIVVLGCTHLEQTDMAAALIAARPARVRHFGLAGQPDPAARMRLLRMETVTRAGYGMTTVITGLDSAEELDYLRELGAHVCHLYGPFSSLYRQIRIHECDLHVSPRLHRLLPDHVLSAEEALTECDARRDRAHQLRRLARA